MDFSFCDSYTRNAFSSSVDDDDDDDDEEARIPPSLSLSPSPLPLPLFSATTRCGFFPRKCSSGRTSKAKVPELVSGSFKEEEEGDTYIYIYLYSCL